MQINNPTERTRLFVASCVALIASALSFAIRGDIMGALGANFHLTQEQVGWIAGAAFWGPTLSVIVGGQLCDLIGIKWLVRLACLAHIVGIALTIMALGFWQLWAATLGIGIANGLIEAGINPLIATLYPDRKTEKLNALHAWFPGGIMIGGLITLALTLMHMDWQLKMAVILAPTLVYGYLFLRMQVPETERVQQGVTTAHMYKEPMRLHFLVWVFCMLLTASTELGPNQWIPNMLTATAGLHGIVVLIWINGLMAAGRVFAGPVIHQLSSIGLLIGASAFSAIGLLLLSAAKSPASAVLASTVFAIGICYFWPTMLGAIAERFPAGGALTLGMMGGAGNLSVALVLPLMGRIYDRDGPAAALRWVVILPAVLIAVFSAIWLHDRSRGGSPEKLSQERN